MTMINYGGNFGGPFVLGGYTGTIIPMTNPGWDFSDPLVQTAKTVTIADITDGTSNTSMWSEQLTPYVTPPPAGVGKNAENRGFFPSPGKNLTQTQAGVQQFLAACRSLAAGTPASGSNMGWQWWSTFPDYVNSNYNHVGTPNSRQCQNNPVNAWGLDIYGSASPNSLHPGGVNVCFGDGSVRFIKDTVNLQTWWALGTRSSGEVVSADAY